MVFSCKKAKNSAAIDFTFTGSPYAGQEIIFRSNADGNTFYWNLGDGHTSTGSIDYHIYADPGTYTVTLVVNNDNSHPVIKDISIGSLPKFYYRGAPCAGDTLFFYTNITSVPAFQWDFGDGTTSTQSAPYHIYADTGSYLVKLNVSNYPANVNCEMPKITIFKNAVYIHLIAGTWLWHHTLIIKYDPNFPSGTTITYPDGTFPITYIDPFSLSIGSNTLVYSKSISLDSTLEFTGNNNSPGNFTMLYFNHYTGNILYTIRNSGSSHDETDYYSTP